MTALLAASSRARARAALVATLLVLAACADEPAAKSHAAPTAPTGAPAAPDEAPAAPAADSPAPPRASEAPADSPADPLAELRALLTRAANEPASFDASELITLESLFFELLPPTEGELAGTEWQVLQVVGAGIAELHIDLVRGAEKQVGIDLKYHPDLEKSGLSNYGTSRVHGYPAIERSHFLFVLVGHTELRFQGLTPPWKSLDPLRALLARFPLDSIASL